MAYGQRPFGLREVVLDDGTSEVTLDAARTLMFTERLVQGELRGDDKVKAVVAYPDALEWSLESGGIPLEAWALMSGREVVVSGSTPNRTRTMTASANDCYPYFEIKGRAIGDGCSDDTVITIMKAKVTQPLNGTFGDGEFFVTSGGGIAIEDGDGTLYTIEQRETGATILPA